MIDRALALLATQLDDGLRQRFGSSETQAALGPVPDLSRTENASSEPVTLSLVRVEEERVTRTQVTTRRRGDDFTEELQPDLKLHLFVLVSSGLKTYSEALRHLAAAVGLFQSKPVFDHSNTPTLDPAIEKLTVELYSLSFEEQNNLWGSLSLKYVPSVLYRVRMIGIQESAVSRVQPAVKEANARQVAL